MNKMTPKEKVKELIHSYSKELLRSEYRINGFVIDRLVKQCALIAVDELIKSSPSLPVLSDRGSFSTDIEESTRFFQEVKSELQNL